MDDDWEDFLGLDDPPPAQEQEQKESIVSQKDDKREEEVEEEEEEDSDKEFQLPEKVQINPLKPLPDQEQVDQHEDQHEDKDEQPGDNNNNNNNSSSNSFAMDFLSTEDDDDDEEEEVGEEDSALNPPQKSTPEVLVDPFAQVPPVLVETAEQTPPEVLVDPFEQSTPEMLVETSDQNSPEVLVDPFEQPPPDVLVDTTIITDDVDMFGLPSPVNETVAESITTVVNEPVPSPSTPQTSADDFMSWLDDKKPTTEEVKSSGQEDASTPNTKLVMDSFFDEVFGDDENHLLSPTGATGVANKNFESQLRKEVSSGFCDVNKIRNLILGAGFLPKSVRGQVWSILIGGSCNEDQEAEFWRPSGNEQVENKEQLMLDCAAAVAKRKGTIYCPGDIEQTEIDMTDILLLYCMRRKKAYQHHFGSLLGPLLVTPLPATRALASSCFYTLCSEFIPLINLSPFRYDQAVRKVDEWIRLLLSYHFPLLVLHLDRVFPGWEQALKPTSATEVLQNTSEALKCASLDDMERNLGLTDESKVESSPNSTASAETDSTIVTSEASKEIRDRYDANSGCIPSPWISGIFGDSLPPEQASAVLDWAILNEEKFFGVYFIASLFGLCSPSLLTMNRIQIKSWITKIVSGVSIGGDEWFKQCAFIATPSLHSNSLLEMNDETEQIEMDWKIFMRGWLHSTTSLWVATPAAFKESVSNTDIWASNLIEEDSVEATLANSMQDRRGLDDSGGIDSKKAKMLKMKNAMEAKSRNVFKRFSKKVESVRKSSPAGFEVDNLNKWEDDEDDNRNWLAQWAHVSKKSFRCVWASAQEVIPSICSTQRKSNSSTSGESKDFGGHFCHGCEWIEGCSEFGVERKGGEHMSFPQLKDEQHNMMASPTYFAVDIRSEAEMKLGKFPKAFSLDPQYLSDPDMISNYLSTLEPVSEIAHLCIMGVGEEYIQVKVNANGASSHNSLDAPSTSFALLNEALTEYHATLMNVVVFFMKKGFRHVSILDGGFVAAARHLLRDDCSSTLGSALVDVYPPALDRILGEGVCAKHLGIKKAQLTSNLFSDQGDPASTGGSALGATVNNAFANFSTSSVGSNLGSFVSNLTTQVSTAGGDGRSQNESLDSNSGSGAGNNSASTAEVGRRLSVFGSTALTSLRKGVSAVAGAPLPPPSTDINQSDNNRNKDARSEANVSGNKSVKSTGGGGMQFVIDEDEDDDEDDDDEGNDGGESNSSTTSEQKQAPSLADSIPDTDKVNVVRSEAEKSQALAMHILAGVQKGDEVKIEKDSLPGAVLFPALKDKMDKDENGMVLLDTKGVPKTKPVHRFLVVTKERFIVLDSKGQGVGSVGLVKSNHHLTELIKITFKKKDPDGVILFISSPGVEPKPHSYKVAKRNDFIKTLQEKMKRFK